MGSVGQGEAAKFPLDNISNSALNWSFKRSLGAKPVLGDFRKKNSPGFARFCWENPFRDSESGTKCTYMYLYMDLEIFMVDKMYCGRNIPYRPMGYLGGASVDLWIYFFWDAPQKK